MRNLLFFDIDGTLITDDGRRFFPESAKQAIWQARKNGNLAFINTGRVDVNVEDFIKNAGFDGIVCGCGTYISYDGEIILHHTIPHDICLETAHIVRECGLFALFEAADRNTVDDQTRIPEVCKDLLKYFSDMNRSMHTSVETEDFYFDKFTAWFDADADILQFKERIAPYYDYIDRGSEMCEIVPKGFSKATGIQFLMDRFQIDVDQVYAFGDSNNDLPMLNFVKHSVGMADSSKEVLQSVSYVTDSVLDDGIANALAHFHMI